MWSKMISDKEELTVQKFRSVLEIGVLCSTCTCSFDEQKCTSELHEDEYLNIPNEHVPSIIKQLIKMYPDWDKECVCINQ